MSNISEEALRHVIDILAGIKPAGDGTQLEGVQTGNPFGDQKAIDAAFVPFNDEGNDTTLEEEAALAEETPIVPKPIPDGFITESQPDVMSEDDLDDLLSE